MAIVKKEEYLNLLRERLGDSTDDCDLKLLEDFSDTYDDMFSQLNNKDETDWKAKYEQNDKEWREKYRARFFDSTTDNENKEPEPKDNDDDNESNVTFDDLFKKGD